MKVKCIKEEHPFFTKDKIYEVFWGATLTPYIVDDIEEKRFLGEYYKASFKVVQEKSIEKNVEPPQKTLRDEFAMAALQGIINTTQSLAETPDKTYQEFISRGAYEIADAMLKVREENANTNE